MPSKLEDNKSFENERSISKEKARSYLKNKYEIPDIIMKALDYIKYDFQRNHSNNYPYAYILEWLCEQLIKYNKMEIMNDKYDGLHASWELDIPIDITKVFDSKSRKKIRNKILLKFLESLDIYEWISISLENQTMEVIDDAICWGFEKDNGPIMTVEKKKDGTYLYKNYKR